MTPKPAPAEPIFRTITSSDWLRHFTIAPTIQNDVSRQIADAIKKARCST